MTAAAIDTIWYTRCPVPTPLGLAAKLGWFDEEFSRDGIAIKSLKETGSDSERESHYDHHLPNSFRQGGNVPAIWARSLGRETRVIGLNWINEFQAIVTLPETGIRAVSDLRGRRLGLPKHANSIDFGRAGALRGFLTALEWGGVSQQDVDWVDLPIAPTTRENADARVLELGFPYNNRSGGSYGTQFKALIRGDVDAIFVKGANGAQITHQLGARIVSEISKHPDPVVRSNNGVPRPITVDSAILRARPDLVVRFLKRIVDVGVWAEEHPAETVAYISRETGASEAWVRYAYGHDVHKTLRTDLSETSIAALDSFKTFLFQKGFLRSTFDTLEWINTGPLVETRNLESLVARRPEKRAGT